MKEIMEKLGARVDIEEAYRVGAETEGRESMMIAKLADTEQKKEVMGKKKCLKGMEERIEDDLTVKEREMQRRLKVIAEEERRKGKRVWVAYGRIDVEGEWWRWDKKRKVLVRGNIGGRTGGRGEEVGKVGAGEGASGRKKSAG